MRFLFYCVPLLLLIGVGTANSGPTEDTNADESMFPDTPFISLKGVREPMPNTSTPQYPADARKNGICGEVLMAVKVGVDGSVTEAKIVKSEPPNVFDKAVMEAIRKWRFKRVSINDEPVVYQTKVPFKFILSDWRDDRPDCHPARQGPPREKASPRP